MTLTVAVLDGSNLEQLRRSGERGSRSEPGTRHTARPTQAKSEEEVSSVCVGDIHITVHTGAGDVPLPPDWNDVVCRMLVEALEGHHVAVRFDDGEEIGTEFIASLLGVTRPTVVAMLDRGDVPFTRTPGNHRRVRWDDLQAYLSMRAARQASIKSLVAHAQEHDMPMGPPEWMVSGAED